MYDETTGEWIDDNSESGADTPQDSGGVPADYQSPQKADPSHVYVGRSGTGDVWQLVDSGGNVIEWTTPAGAPSTQMIPGTARNLGAPSAMSVAQANGTAAPSGGSGGDHIPDDPSHIYVGSDSRGDIYQLTDSGGNVIRWHVTINGDSRNPLPGTIENLGPRQTPISDPPAPVTPTSPPRVTVPGNVLITAQPVPNTQTTGAPRQSDPRHKYVGRDSRGDVWQLFDGANVIEWAVKAGDESGNILPGTVRNLGAPSPATTAQADGYPPPDYNDFPTPIFPGTTTPTPAASNGGFSAVALIGLAASVLGAFK